MRYRDCTIFKGVTLPDIQYGVIIVRYLGTVRNCYWYAIRPNSVGNLYDMPPYCLC